MKNFQNNFNSKPNLNIISNEPSDIKNFLNKFNIQCLNIIFESKLKQTLYLNSNL